MYGSINLVTRLAEDRAAELRREAAHLQQARSSGKSARARLAHALHALAERLEPEDEARQIPALR